VLDAVVGLAERLQSSRLGEGLIVDLRKQVFGHVQRMPIAFFMRTHTGALVSRLNNDVIGAQRAFTSALSGVVTNVIALVLTLAVMFELSWEITLLSVVLLPVFVIPARRVGSKVGTLQREAADHNSAMTSQMTERFSAPGATLVKLYGRPDQEAAEFGHRADRVRDIGVRTAVATEVFFRALTLVSGLAQALIYGLGGYLALQGELAPGTVVTLALLLNRLYGPLTALATARLDVVTALVSFDRIFEVLDVEPLIAEPEHPVALPAGRTGRRIPPAMGRSVACTPHRASSTTGRPSSLARISWRATANWSPTAASRLTRNSRATRRPTSRPTSRSATPTRCC